MAAFLCNTISVVLLLFEDSILYKSMIYSVLLFTMVYMDTCTLIWDNKAVTLTHQKQARRVNYMCQEQLSFDIHIDESF